MRVIQVANFGSALKAGEILVRADISILHHVLCFGIVPQNSPGNPAEALVVTPHE